MVPGNVRHALQRYPLAAVIASLVALAPLATALGAALPIPGPPCPDYACDSAVVRTILDANSLGETTVPEVATVTGGRISSLALEYRHLDTLLPEVGRLSALRTLRVDRNDLRALPAEIGALHSLEMLLMDNNRLERLPSEIGDLDSLRILVAFTNRLESLPGSIGRLSALGFLRVEGNRITRLPPAFLALKPTEMFGIENNRICSPPDSVAAWIDLFSAGRDWKASQTSDGEAACVTSVRGRPGSGRIPFVEVYPDPSGHSFRFRFHAEGTKSLAWYDNRGRLRGRWQGLRAEGALAASSPPGLYWVRAVAGNRVAVLPVLF